MKEGGTEIIWRMEDVHCSWNATQSIFFIKKTKKLLHLNKQKEDNIRCSDDV